MWRARGRRVLTGVVAAAQGLVKYLKPLMCCLPVEVQEQLDHVPKKQVATLMEQVPSASTCSLLPLCSVPALPGPALPGRHSFVLCLGARPTWSRRGFVLCRPVLGSLPVHVAWASV